MHDRVQRPLLDVDGAERGHRHQPYTMLRACVSGHGAPPGAQGNVREANGEVPSLRSPSPLGDVLDRAHPRRAGQGLVVEDDLPLDVVEAAAQGVREVLDEVLGHFAWKPWRGQQPDDQRPAPLRHVWLMPARV
jgi:hypothetical protein